VPATAPAGATQITVTSNDLASASAPFTVTRTTVTSVSPVAQTRGGNVAINGTNFDTTCANNLVTLAGISVVPMSCTATRLDIQVPVSAAYGATQVSVTRYGATSNSVAFTVARQPGVFQNITNDINTRKNSPRTCSTGEVRLEISGSYVAAFKRTANNSTIASVSFDDETLEMTPYSGATPVTWTGGGGAGFSLCSTGVVLDLNASDLNSHFLGYRFVRLQEGTQFYFTFNYFSAVRTDSSGVRHYHTATPEIHRSPDGTLFLAVVPSDTTDTLRAVVIDRQRGTVLGQVELPRSGPFVSSATVTSGNAVVITSGTNQYPGIPIG
jgi:uncharacterized protein (TIGR03437 family)